MAQLVLLVVAAVWAAVLIPPLLRSRVENRPNSSVHDFRRQLNKLQSTATPPRGTMRAMGRPLAASPRQRQHGGHAAGRVAPASLRGSAPAIERDPRDQRHAHSHRHTDLHRDQPRQRTQARHGDGPYRRTHGDPTGGQARPSNHSRSHGMARPTDPMSSIKRRRSNVLFMLVALTASTLFLYATTASDAMMYVFALSFLALCGYVYLLAQLRQREQVGWGNGWLDQR